MPSAGTGALRSGPRVYLRAPRARDRDAFLELVKASRALHRPWVEPPDTAEGYAAFLRRSRSSRTAAVFAWSRKDDALVGVFVLSEIVGGVFQSAYLGTYGHARHAGKGFMTEALRLTVRYAFDDLGLHRVEANIQPGNVRSIALFRRCGFRREGYSPRYLKIRQRWRDHERWALLRDGPAGSGRAGTSPRRPGSPVETGTTKTG
jgi:[ribosomal protein S5]-alanine N-acetyltransferase